MFYFSFQSNLLPSKSFNKSVWPIISIINLDEVKKFRNHKK